MYSREEAKKIREQFWTSFGQYLRVISSADGEKVNWVNYKTGVKHIHFRMDADKKSAHIAIEIAHPDEGIRALMFAQFLELRHILHDTLQEEWEWDEVYFDTHGKQISRISITINEVSVFKKEDWPSLISFFKPRIIALDEFWSMAKYSFDIFK